jgi:hypothetical protein
MRHRDRSKKAGQALLFLKKEAKKLPFLKSFNQRGAKPTKMASPLPLKPTPTQLKRLKVFCFFF